MEMDRWRNKVAVITGAGSGMGAACAIEFIKAGIIVIGIGRRVGRIEYVKNSMPPDLIKNFHPVKCDVIVEKEVVDTFKWIVDTFGGVDVLVNCAGIYKEGTLVDKYNTESYKNCLYICLMGAMFATREAYASMKARNAPGHIFYITSSLVKETGYIPYWEQADINIMGANVHGLRAMVETYRQEFREHKAQVKTTNISVGVVATDIWIEDIRTFVAEFPFLEPRTIADAILYALNTPPNVEITEFTIKPLGERF